MIAQILAMVISSWLKGRSKGLDECEARGFFGTRDCEVRISEKRDAVSLAAYVALGTFARGVRDARAEAMKLFAG